MAATLVGQTPTESWGTVVKLDRGFPLVRLDGEGGEGGKEALLRCEHSAALTKGQVFGDSLDSDATGAVIGDRVLVDVPEGHDKGILLAVARRDTTFVRKDPAQRTAKQVLAANFSMVIVVEPLVDLNRRRLERELVLAHNTGASVAVVLTKADLLSAAETAAVTAEVQALAGASVPVLVVGAINNPSAATDELDAVAAMIPAGTMAILIGKSGVGKSTLVNALAGTARSTSAVRASDGKGRHTTVDRALVTIPGGGTVVDMPGVRGLGLWDAEAGLSRAFVDIETLGEKCRFRDCTHHDEPGCAVAVAVEEGTLSPERLASYHSLVAELASLDERREEARRLRGEKVSDRKHKGRR